MYIVWYKYSSDKISSFSKKASSANKLVLYYNHTVMPIAQKQFETSFALSTKSLKLARALHILTQLRCQSIALHIKDVQTSTLFIFQGSVLCQPSYWQGTRKRAERYLIFKAALFPLRIVVNYVFEKYVP